MAEKVKKDGIKGGIGGGLRLNTIGRYEAKIMCACLLRSVIFMSQQQVDEEVDGKICRFIGECVLKY